MLRWASLGAEAVDEVGESELAVDQVLVVVGDMVDQFAHQGGVDLLELAERLTALVEHLLVPGLPAFQLADLPGPLLPGDLGGLLGQLQLLLLMHQDLPLDIERLRLQRHHRMQQGHRVPVGIEAGGRGRRLPGGGYFHPVRP